MTKLLILGALLLAGCGGVARAHDDGASTAAVVDFATCDDGTTPTNQLEANWKLQGEISCLATYCPAAAWVNGPETNECAPATWRKDPDCTAQGRTTARATAIAAALAADPCRASL